MTRWMPDVMPQETYDPFTVGLWLLIFVGIPLVFGLIVTLLHMAPGWTRGGRHRPGQAWDASPVVIDSGVTVDPEVTHRPDADGPDRTDRGSSARW